MCVNRAEEWFVRQIGVGLEALGDGLTQRDADVLTTEMPPVSDLFNPSLDEVTATAHLVDQIDKQLLEDGTNLRIWTDRITGALEIAFNADAQSSSWMVHYQSIVKSSTLLMSGVIQHWASKYR